MNTRKHIEVYPRPFCPTSRIERIDVSDSSKNEIRSRVEGLQEQYPHEQYIVMAVSVKLKELQKY